MTIQSDYNLALHFTINNRSTIVWRSDSDP